MSVYKANATMRLLGKQCYSSILNEDVFNSLNDIARVRPSTFTKDAAMDIFMLGYIHGKRAERDMKREVC